LRTLQLIDIEARLAQQCSNHSQLSGNQ